MFTRRTMFKTIAALAATALVPPAFWLARKAETVPAVRKGWQLKHKYWINTRKQPLTLDETQRIISDHIRNFMKQTANAECRAFYNPKGATHAR